MEAKTDEPSSAFSRMLPTPVAAGGSAAGADSGSGAATPAATADGAPAETGAGAGAAEEEGGRMTTSLEDAAAAITNVALREEVEDLIETWPAKTLRTLTDERIQVIVSVTAYRKLVAKIHVPTDYPASKLLVDLSSATLHPNVLKKLSTGLVDVVIAENAGRKHLLQVLDALLEQVESNKLLFVMEELRDVSRLVKEKGGTLKMNEAEGTIQVRLTNGDYNAKFTVAVPEDYPEEMPTTTINASNFHDTINRVFAGHAEHIARKAVQGYSAAQVLKSSDAAQVAPAAMPSSSEREIRITSSLITDLRHDVKFLKQASDIRAARDRHVKSSEHTDAAKQRKTMRRRLKRLTRSEAASEKEREEEDIKLLERQYASANSVASDVPLRSVGTLLTYLINDFMGLPQELCQVCKTPVMQESAAKTARYLEVKQHLKRPERIYCGHWYHYGCLDTFLTNPPFEKMCPTCDRRVTHPDWPTDVKKLEKQWASQQAKQRELSELADLMGL